jgi:peptidoglycan hydrolase-like protein with peptidoglycan-binding domain
MRDALSDFITGLDGDSGPVAVVLAGAFVRGPAGAYLVPVSKIDNGPLLPQAFPLNTVLTVLAQYPGRSVLILGESPVDVDPGPFLTAGAGAFDIPQGVTVLRGPATDAARFSALALLTEDQPLIPAAEEAGLTVEGFAGRGLVFLRAEDVEPLGSGPTPLGPEADDAAWNMAQQADDAFGYQAYLDRFPEGRHAAAATQRLTAIAEDPYYAQRRQEERLELSREARREIQRDLTILGYNTRGVDGIFGRGTRSAIRKWQTSIEVDVSGYLSRPQILRLDAQAAVRAAELEDEARLKREAEERADRAFWAEVGGPEDEVGLRAYLERYPQGLEATTAKRWLREIEKARAEQAAAQDRAAWDEAVAEDSVASYKTYLSRYPDGAFAPKAKGRIRALERDDKSERDVAQARAEEQGLVLNAIGRQLAEARLANLGINPGTVDGRFDDRTRKALAEFQRTRGLRVSGYLDEQTVVRLLADGIIQP